MSKERWSFFLFCSLTNNRIGEKHWREKEEIRPGAGEKKGLRAMTMAE
jgi:hypothetical protein